MPRRFRRSTAQRRRRRSAHASRVSEQPAPRRLPAADSAAVAPAAANGRPVGCLHEGLLPLREEAEKRGKLIKAAGERKAPPDEACKLIGNFSQAEVKMIKYVEANAAKCGIPPQIAEQIKTGHKNTEAMQHEGLRAWRSRRSSRAAGRPEPERSAGLFGLAAGSDADQEGRQHLRYAERQRSHAMTRSR